MIKLYLKQAWELLKQNRLFSTLYIVGTGLAIAMTVIMAVVYYVKIAPIYPEVNRKHTLYVRQGSFKKGPEGQQWLVQSGFSYKALQDWFYPLQNALVVSASTGDYEESYVQPEGGGEEIPVKAKLTDPAFFRIYPFRFLEGKAFTEADLQSGIEVAVVTDELARRLFGTAEGVMGRTFSLDNVGYRVCGVVKGASYLMSESFAQVYMPYSVVPGYKTRNFNASYAGSFRLTLLVKDGAQADALRQEIKEIARKHNLSISDPNDDWAVDFWEQPTSHLLSVFQEYVSEELDVWSTVGQFLLILLVLLLVPALNLSGMIASRMEVRLPEMGVRKAFGAGQGMLLRQVMWENLLLTLLGGLLGLLLAWLSLYVARQWVFEIFERWSMGVPPGVDVRLTGEMLFAPLVFLSALLLCLLLNLLSALIPAWHSLRNPIVKSLNEKR